MVRTGRIRATLIGVAVVVASLVAGPAAARATAAGTSAADETAPTPEQRAAQLVAQLTLDEKITQLHGIRDANHQRFVPGVARLNIPPLRITNGPAGVGPSDDRQQQPATALPAPISLAATFDRALAGTYGDVQGAETRDLAHSLLEAPDINLTRVPENGRTFETYGEDPFLAGRLSAADIRGVQRHGIIAEVKHFAANNQETNRFAVNEVIDERTLQEIYLPAFETSVKQGRAGTVMCAYPRVNGSFACENQFLYNVLRGQWGFDGFVQSDFGAAHSTVPSALAGMDLEMPTGEFYDTAMRAAVDSGQISESVIDQLIIRRYAIMIRFGLFDRPLTLSPIPAEQDGAIARRIAEQGTVLLKNSGGQLPLDSAATRRVAVIGPFAGAAHTGGGGSSHVVPLYTVDPVTGIKNRLGADSGADVSFADGSDVTAAADLARSADVALVMVGDNESEGRDRAGLSLTGNQDQLVSAVAAANPHTVVVVKSGAPVLMPWLDEVPAVVEAWYPGEEDGNAVAAVLFGDVNPSGKLPVTFPRADADTPAHTPDRWPGVAGVATYSEGMQIGYRWYDAQDIAPLFPFGYGLSYTSFRYDNLTVGPRSPDQHAARPGAVTVGVDVTNTGSRAGADVAQVYVGAPAGAGEPPRQLKGFEKVFLRPGQTRHVTFVLDRRAFSVWDTTAHAWTVVPGGHQVWAGDSSRDLPLHATVDIRAGG